MNRPHPAAIDDARAKIARSPFAKQANEILRNATPLIRLDPLCGKGARHRSWLGGEPHLPPDVEWPTWDPTARVMRTIARREKAISEYRPQDHSSTLPGWVAVDPTPFMRKAIDNLRRHIERVPRPISFLGQIDLAEAGDAADFVDLPRRGTLWFFHDADLYYPTEAGSWRVIYRDVEPSALGKRATPRGVRVFNRTVVDLRPGLALAKEARPKVRGKTHKATDTLESKWIHLACRLQRPTGCLYSLGGGSSDPQWCRPRVWDIARNRDRKTTLEEWKQIERDSASLQLLLYVESDDTGKGPGWQWGDCGALTFWLHECPWKTQAFHEALAYMDTT